MSDDLRVEYQTARAAWPSVSLAEEHFVAYLSERAAPDVSLNAGDLYLACACVHQVPAALAAFERELMSRVPGFLARLGRSSDFTDEVCQRLRARLLMPAGDRPARIAEYSGRGALASWLRVAAVRTAIDVLRSAGELPGERLDADATALVAAGNPELDYLKQRYKDELGDALRSGLQALSARERNILRLHAVDELTLDEIGAMYRVGKSTAFRWLAAARDKLLAEARLFLQQKRGVDTAEFDSLVNLVRSQLDLSLPALRTAG